MSEIKDFIRSFKYSIGMITFLVSILLANFVIPDSYLIKSQLVFLGFALGMGYWMLVEWSYSR
jgi:hypothetical protein